MQEFSAFSIKHVQIEKLACLLASIALMHIVQTAVTASYEAHVLQREAFQQPRNVQSS